MTRYADDFIVQCKTREEAEKVLGEIREWVEKAGLTLHPTKTRIVNVSEPGGCGGRSENRVKVPI